MNTLGTALYYPNFHMTPEWGKAALLYWDSLARIVPQGAQPTIDNDDEFSAELTGARVLENIDTTDYVDEAASRFKQYLVPLFEEDPAVSFDAKYVATLLKSVTSIHPGKLTKKLQDDLRAMGVGADDTGFLRVPAELGGPYMLCLGTVMKERLGLPLVTDAPSFERLGEYLAFGAPTADAEDPSKKALLRLGLPMPSSQNLRNVELDEILRFRDERRPERLRLRTALEAIMKDASEIDDPNRLKLYWDAKRNEAETAVNDYKRCLRAINLIDMASLFKVSVPTGIATSIASASGALGEITAAALTTLAFSVDVAGVLGNRLYRKQTADQKNPWLYALQVRSKYGR